MIILFAAVVSPLAALAQSTGGGRVVAMPAAIEVSAGRIDRTVVSPFDDARRIVVRPKGFEDAPVAPPLVAPAATGGIAPVPVPGNFVDIGDIDGYAPPEGIAPTPAPRFGVVGTPCGDDCPVEQVEFLDIRPYYGDGGPPALTLPD